MQTLSEIKAMLAGAGLSPRKALGQNFLVDHNLIRKLVDLTQYEEHLKRTQQDADTRWENVKELINFATEEDVVVVDKGDA